ncbi:hypothetical protein B7494_g7482 [Chlorociboria aeruginascens]|nr:hypothetical protein B7494_g7482 [Chlorociboria aeruginascens]
MSISTESFKYPPARDQENDLSMFFNFGSQVPEPAATFVNTSTTTTSVQSQDSLNRGGIRVSLACVPCRSRHVKCGAEMPGCKRCSQDDKPCFYAKSRRGMRDRNAPRRKVLARENKIAATTGQNGQFTLENVLGGTPSNSYSYPASDASGSPSSSHSRLSTKPINTRRLLDLYYNFFHKSHPFVLPRYNFMARLESDPESLQYLLPVMQYVGSLFASDIPSAGLRDIALNQLNLPDMPLNGFTVQTLLLLAIATHCEDEILHSRSILDRAIYTALDISMNTSNFANLERDPVLAESWRRTYWGLFVIDGTFACINTAPSFLLYAVEANVELPCDGCDYDSGMIPRPHTLHEYDARDFEEETPVFSSFTYLIDLVRISGSILALDNVNPKVLEPAVANADAMLVNWKLHLPREKQGVVDKNEDIDELLFQAQYFYQALLITIHRPLSRLFQSPAESLSRCVPPPITKENNGSNERAYWLHTKKTLEAAEAAVNLFALPSPILLHTPLGSCGVTRATLAHLSACAYIHSGNEWNTTRDRIRLGLGTLKTFGEVWSMSRRIEKDLKKVARSVFSTPGMGVGHALAGYEFALDGTESVVSGFEDLSELEYLELMNANANANAHANANVVNTVNGLPSMNGVNGLNTMNANTMNGMNGMPQQHHQVHT